MPFLILYVQRTPSRALPEDSKKQRNDTGNAERPGSAVVFSFPLRVIHALTRKSVSLLYLFPGQYARDFTGI